ncbi:MAG: hypothetical protein AAF202_12260, partial [Pseudomonadota bacterium]
MRPVSRASRTVLCIFLTLSLGLQPAIAGPEPASPEFSGVSFVEDLKSLYQAASDPRLSYTEKSVAVTAFFVQMKELLARDTDGSIASGLESILNREKAKGADQDQTTGRDTSLSRMPEILNRIDKRVREFLAETPSEEELGRFDLTEDQRAQIKTHSDLFKVAMDLDLEKLWDQLSEGLKDTVDFGVNTGAIRDADAGSSSEDEPKTIEEVLAEEPEPEQSESDETKKMKKHASLILQFAFLLVK